MAPNLQVHINEFICTQRVWQQNYKNSFNILVQKKSNLICEIWVHFNGLVGMQDGGLQKYPENREASTMTVHFSHC